MPGGTLPFWPRYLDRSEAALYVGVSGDTFMAEVNAGTWPPGRPRGGKGGKLTWDRVLLDRAADAHSGIGDSGKMPDILADAAATAVEARINGQAERQRDQHRHPEKA